MTDISQSREEDILLPALTFVSDCLIFDSCSGKFHRVSRTAAFILYELKQQTSISDLIAAYAAQFKIPLLIAARDIELFLNDMSVTR